MANRGAGQQNTVPVIVNPKGRQPVISTNGSNLNGAHVPVANVPHISNPYQRKKG